MAQIELISFLIASVAIISGALYIIFKIGKLSPKEKS